MPRSIPAPPLRHAPFTGIYDTLIDIAEREEARRATLATEERDEEDRLTAERKEREQQAWLATHANEIDIREERGEDGQLHVEAHDRQRYPFVCYPQYDVAGQFPDVAPAPNPVGEHFARGLVARARERRFGRCKPPASAPITAPLTHGEQVEAELANLLANHEAEERRRASLTWEECAAEDLAWDTALKQIVASAQREARAMLTLRRAADDTIRRLSRAVLTARGFQALLALRRDTDDVYFATDDGA